MGVNFIFLKCAQVADKTCNPYTHFLSIALSLLIKPAVKNPDQASKA